MKNYGLIGQSLSHTFSPKYFTDKFEKEGIEATYKAFELDDINDLRKLIQDHNLAGVNITIPYKKRVMRFMDEMDPLVSRAKAVNTIKVEGGKLIGYNTDLLGFRKSLRDQIGYKRAAAIVLGTGGGASAIKGALEVMGIPYLVVSRNTRVGDLTYKGLTKRIFEQYNLIINTTPVGMYPNEDEAPDIPYEFLTENHFVYDLIYNPEKTKFLSLAENKGCNVQNGLEMLHQQAEESWKIWNK
ncbi:shikimate dehydrogenase [bacterium SCSIO 12643]|nr:shikimate dehydrogenase [bacterium SCSIO 12643]